MIIPEPSPRHAGSRQAPSPPHVARAFKALQRQVDDIGWQKNARDLHAVSADITDGIAVTGGGFADRLRMWTYRDGAAVYADCAAGCGAGSVVQVRLACPDLSITGSAAVSDAGGEQVLRVSLDLPDAWVPGDAHYVTVQAFRSSGSDATTIQVIRGWQR